LQNLQRFHTRFVEFDNVAARRLRNFLRSETAGKLKQRKRPNVFQLPRNRALPRASPKDNHLLKRRNVIPRQSMRFTSGALLPLALFLLQAPGQPQSETATFGTTIVVPFGLRGLIYFIPPRTSALPAFSTMDAVGAIYTPSLNVPPRAFQDGFPGVTDRFEWFAIDYTGRFWIDPPGNYQFQLMSDDGAKLYIDGRPVADNDGIHPPRQKIVTANLSGGIHRIRVSYFQGPKNFLALTLHVTGPDGKWQVFSTDNFKPPSDPAQWKYGTPGDLGPDSPITTFQAPIKAQEAFVAGAAALADGNLHEAKKRLEQATKIYGNYAQAWSVLGNLRVIHRDFGHAREAYERALAANNDYTPAYVHLANLDLSQRHYDEVLRTTSRALVRQPIDNPLIYFFDAVANERLKHFDAAEKSARRATELDMAREAPQAEYLLGTLLAARHDVPGALQHLKTYLTLVPNSRGSDEVRSTIQALERSR